MRHGNFTLTAWQLDLPVLIALVVLAGIYFRTRRPETRTATFLFLGLASIAVVTMGPLGAFDRTLFWPAATENALLLTLIPLLLALGGLTPPLPRFLAFPPVGAVLCLVVTMALYFTPLFRLSLTNGVVHELVRLLLVAVGCLFCWPLLGERGSYPMRMVYAFVDGLLDAIPGIIVMTGHTLIAAAYYRGLHLRVGPSLRWDQTIGGGLMLTLAEATAIPLLAALFVRWARSETAPAPLPRADEELLQRPWWETDPGPLKDRR
jgi:cytochrome c oxidase assembly factor CtaG